MCRIPRIEALFAAHNGPVPQPVRRAVVADRGLAAHCRAHAQVLGRLAQQSRQATAAARLSTKLDVRGMETLEAMASETARLRRGAVMWTTLVQALDKLPQS